jgi:hypothetical protein
MASIRHDILDALRTQLLTIKKGKDYDVGLISVEMFGNESTSHSENTPDVVIRVGDQELLVPDIYAGYNRWLMPVDLQIMIGYGSTALKKLLLAIESIGIVLQTSTMYDGSDLHLQCLRCRLISVSDVVHIETIKVAATVVSLEILFYEARS